MTKEMSAKERCEFLKEKIDMYQQQGRVCFKSNGQTICGEWTNLVIANKVAAIANEECGEGTHWVQTKKDYEK